MVGGYSEVLDCVPRRWKLEGELRSRDVGHVSGV